MKQILKNSKLILMEMAIVEKLRRSKDIALHQTLINAPLIYNRKGKEVLQNIYQDYIDIALDANIPFLMCTPTWRTNQSRVFKSEINNTVNIDAVHFMQNIRAANHTNQDKIKIGGMIGCKNDCYLPEEGLSTVEAEQFHSWQIEQLVLGGVDFLIAETLPNVEEALGIAKAMEKTGVPYIISFVISLDGYVLDGTSLSDAINLIDSQTDIKPLGFMVNCSYPTFLCVEKQPKELFHRLIGFQANASALDHCDLENSDQLKVENISDWGNHMLELNKIHNIKILGGCCGTGNEHLHYIVKDEA